MKTDFTAVVSFSETMDTEFLFCQAAEKHSESTLCESKGLLGGVHYDSPNIQELKKKHFDSFTIVSHKGGHVRSGSSMAERLLRWTLEGPLDTPRAHPRADLPEVQL